MRGTAALVLLLAVAGCGGGRGELRVSAAASLKGAFTAYDPHAHYSFAGSDQLAAQIRAGARPDVYAAANRELPRSLFAAGLVERPVAFARNRLVLATRSSRIRSLADAARPGVTIAIGSPTVPAGAYARRVLAAVPEGRRILANVRSQEPDVGGIVGKVSEGAVDAGFVYLTDARAARLRAIRLPRASATYAVRRGQTERRRAPVRPRAPDRRGSARAPAGGLPAPTVRPFTLVAALALAVALSFLTLPVVAIFVHTGPGALVSSLGDAAALDALRLSLETSAIALAFIVVVGTPAAYLLATRRFRGRALVTTLVELPLVLPPAVAGIGLLAALGPTGLLDLGLVFQTAGVVVALAFVSAPFYLRQAQAAFEAVDPSLLEASRTLGAGPAQTFARVAIPVARSGLAAGAALAWGRALGEFGATLMFAGSFRGVTQTAPLAIYERFATDFTGALALSAVLVAVSLALLLSVKAVDAPR